MSSEHVIGILKNWAVIRGTSKYHQFETQEGFETAVKAVWSLVNLSQSHFLEPNVQTQMYHTLSNSFLHHEPGELEPPELQDRIEKESKGEIMEVD